jgi:hypothetical protein
MASLKWRGKESGEERQDLAAQVRKLTVRSFIFGWDFVGALLDVAFQVVREQDKWEGSVIVHKGLATGSVQRRERAVQWCASTEVVKEERFSVE